MDDCEPVVQSVPWICIIDWQWHSLSNSWNFASANKDLGTVSQILNIW